MTGCESSASLRAFLLLDGALADVLVDDLLDARLVVEDVQHGAPRLLQLVVDQLAPLDVRLHNNCTYIYIYIDLDLDLDLYILIYIYIYLDL